MCGGHMFPHDQPMVLFYCYVFYISFSVCARMNRGACREAGVQLAGVSVPLESNSCQAHWQGSQPTESPYQRSNPCSP